mmetsp:Transcript_4046/g.4168  ORF Transcript_4046/g.4168 Transcript_4046/m.4168 type:complete len:638 (+) Transcript_4046:100-2013(+)
MMISKCIQRQKISLRPLRKYLSSETGNINAWNLGEHYKKEIGHRTVIIAHDDSASQELSQRMWYEIQKSGIEASFYTVKTVFATPSSVREGLEIVRRTGAKSVISIGSSTICDTGKGIQTLIQHGFKSVDELDSHLLAINRSKDDSGEDPANKTKIHDNNDQTNSASVSKSSKVEFSHFSVATDISPAYDTPYWSALHPEDDVLIRRPCYTPEVVFDPEVLKKSVDLMPSVINPTLLAHLFDSLFSYTLKQAHILSDKRNNENYEKEKTALAFQVACEENHLPLQALFANTTPEDSINDLIPIEDSGVKTPVGVLPPSVTSENVCDRYIEACEAINSMRFILCGENSDQDRERLAKELLENSDQGGSLEGLDGDGGEIEGDNENNEDSDINHIKSDGDSDNDNDDKIDKEKMSKVRESIHKLLGNEETRKEKQLEQQQKDIQRQLEKQQEEKLLQEELYNEKKTEITIENYHLNILQTVSFIYSLRSHQKGIKIPLAWIESMAFKHCLDLIIKEREANHLALSVDDRLVLSSAIFTLHIMTDLLKITESEMVEIVNTSVEKMTSDKAYLKIKEQSLKKTKNEKGDGMTPAGLIEGWIVTEEMALEKLNRETSKSVLLKMLKSDFFLDLTENTFKYAK